MQEVWPQMQYSTLQGPYPGKNFIPVSGILFSDFGKNPEYKLLAEKAPAIFDFYEDGKDGNWAQVMFEYNTLSWSLIYLDGLETNLNLIKATI